MSRGEWNAGVALYGEGNPVFAICDHSGPRNAPMEALLSGSPAEVP